MTSQLEIETEWCELHDGAYPKGQDCLSCKANDERLKKQFSAAVRTTADEIHTAMSCVGVELASQVGALAEVMAYREVVLRTELQQAKDRQSDRADRLEERINELESRISGLRARLGNS